MDPAFLDAMNQGYASREGEPSLLFGSPMHDGEVASSVRVRLPLAMANRHGLIAGATGTGKTKTLQLLAGQLSAHGVPVFVSDIKGDVTGIAAPGNTIDARVQERAATLAWDYTASGHPTELVSLSGKLGAQVRASVHSFGPTLLGKVLDLNETQTAVLSVVFKYCDDNALPLLDIADLRTTLAFLTSEEAKPILEEYGALSKASVGVILRSLITLEQEGADAFFGEPEFDVADLMRLAPDGSGIVTLLELSDVMDRPRLFSTFMLWMLAQLYETLPEAGDLPKPKLCFFFDEAHLLFDDASETLLDQIELTVRLIRSKGVGVYFVTQSPTDVPSSVLAQLGNRVQHALRAFTPEDADDLRKTARTFPTSEFYDVEKTITSLGIGEALVTVLSSRGVPTPLAATLLLPPDSLMAALDATQLQGLMAAGQLLPKYSTPIDRHSAHEIISGRIAAARPATPVGPSGPIGGGTAIGEDRVLTPAQQEREIQRRAREMERERMAAERERREIERDRKRYEREATAERRRQERERTAVIRETSKVLRSRGVQSVLRSVFDVLGGRR